MRILFISNHFPGDLGPLARQLAASPDNEVLFASCRQRRGYALEGVRRVRLKNAPLVGEDPPTAPALWERALRRGDNGLRTLSLLRQTWGAPDMIFAALAGGAALFARQAFPESFLAAYAETGLKNLSLLPDGARDAWTLLQGALFLQGQICFAFSERQRRLFPELLHTAIRLTTPCVDTRVFSREAARPWFAEGPESSPDDAPHASLDGAPVGSPGTLHTSSGSPDASPDAPHMPDTPAGPLLTLDASGPEGGRLTMPLARAALQRLPASRVVMLTENEGLRQALEQAAGSWPEDSRRRFAVFSSLPFERYRDLLAASALVVRPGGGSERALLECMSCETLLMTRADAAGFLRPGVNMLELPAGDPAGAVLAELEAWRRDGSPSPVARMARRTVLRHFSEEVAVPAHLAEVMQAYAAWKRGRA